MVHYLVSFSPARRNGSRTTIEYFPEIEAAEKLKIIQAHIEMVDLVGFETHGLYQALIVQRLILHNGIAKYYFS